MYASCHGDIVGETQAVVSPKYVAKAIPMIEQ
jgi:hypothetical protein